MVNQVELHPYHQQRELQEYCREHGIVLQAYASLGGQDAGRAGRYMHYLFGAPGRR